MRVPQAIITAVIALLVLAPTSLATISVPWAVGAGGTGTDRGGASTALYDEVSTSWTLGPHAGGGTRLAIVVPSTAPAQERPTTPQPTP